MHVGAAQFLRAHLLAGRGLHQRRPAEKDGALVAHDDALVRHRRHVGAAGGAGAHDDGDLRNAERGHARLVVEDAAEVPLVREDLVLQRQERAAGIDQVDAGQMVLARDLLRAQVLLHRHGIVGAALDGGVVGDDDAFAAADAADAGDDAGGMHVAAVEPVGGERRELEERRAGIEQQVDALARQKFAARDVPRPRLLAAALDRGIELVAQVGDQALHRRGVGGEFVRARVDGGCCHRRGLHLSPLAARGRPPKRPEGLPAPSAPRALAQPSPRKRGEGAPSSLHIHCDTHDAFTASCRRVPGRSACAGSRWCRRRSRRAWRRADNARWDSR